MGGCSPEMEPCNLAPCILPGQLCVSRRAQHRPRETESSSSEKKIPLRHGWIPITRLEGPFPGFFCLRHFLKPQPVL
ncbi:hypothetical protein XENTR_v10017298 [Xenopus tropicalis]|nr:hypothetical protein XENTR_v10017298 [Xenopus tropicalis]